MLARPTPAEQAAATAVAAISVAPATDTITAVSLEGEWDLTTAPELIAIAQRLTAQGQHLIIDLSEVTFIDASTVRALLEADRLARERGCDLVVQLGGAGFAERVLGITGADRRLATAATRRAALQFVAAPA